MICPKCQTPIPDSEVRRAANRIAAAAQAGHPKSEAHRAKLRAALAKARETRWPKS